MSTIQKIREVLGLPQVKLYAEERLDDGRVIVTEAESFEPGVEVRVLDDSGEVNVIDAGEYTLDNGTIISVNEESRLATMGEDEDLENEDKEEMSEDLENKVEMNRELATAALLEAFPNLDEETATAIVDMVLATYDVSEEEEEVVEEELSEEPTEEVEAEVEVEIEVELEKENELAKVIEEAFASIEARLKALEEEPASEGVKHSPNKFATQHKSENKSLNGVERALHIINSHK
jgi:hypothetical protein